jgi:flagellar hook-associated protein 1 FlgK
MALSSALNAAQSGLTITARRAEVVSSNIANAATPGYARREVMVQPNAYAPGVQSLGIQRQGNPSITLDRRSAGADSGAANFLSEQLLRIERAFGTPGQGDSLTDAINRFDSALIRAAAAPDATANLAAVATTAKGLTRQFAQASATIQQTRADADARIGAEVGQLNTTLSRIADLDKQIVAVQSGGRDASALADQRQTLVDKVAQIIPLREVMRSDGRPALIALSGAPLLDGRPATFGFTPTPTISAANTAPLSGLTLNGQPLSTDATSLIAGGTLQAAFTLRDSITPNLQAGLDALAANLAGRLAAADTTRAANMPGLMTDTGSPVDPAATTGLSARLRLNGLADPDQGGDLRFLRDGLGATLPGPVGDGRQLRALQGALTAPTPRSFAGQAGELLDNLSAHRVTAETDATRATARASIMAEAEAATGVSTDQELQDLLQIEKAYAANARVMQVIDGLLQTLLEV